MKEDLNILIKDKSDTGILRLVMNNSDQRNPLSESMMSALMNEIKEASSDKSTRVIVLAAIGNVFSSGHDLKEINDILSTYLEFLNIFFDLQFAAPSQNLLIYLNLLLI